MIVPIIKNKVGITSDKGKYRPVTTVTAASKLSEIVLPDIVDEYLVSYDIQFGFKSKYSAELCIYTLKSVIQLCKDYNSPVYACFLDASQLLIYLYNELCWCI